LANGVGNLIARLFNSKIKYDPDCAYIDEHFIAQYRQFLARAVEHYDRCDFQQGLIAIESCVDVCNRMAPWRLSDASVVRGSVRAVLDSLLALLCPVIPDSADKLKKLDPSQQGAFPRLTASS
jgi:methionyl-tRNA synthetase